MENIKRQYSIKSITDVCSSKENNFPEFRITEVKAMMRFWWRALNYYEEEIDMRSEEGKIFGNADKIKSPVLLKTKRIPKGSSKCHEVGWNAKKNCAINIKSIELANEVEIELSLKKRIINGEMCFYKDINFYDSIFKISLILGGIGRRSRRGRGCFYLIENNDTKAKNENLCDSINEYLKKLKVDNIYTFNDNNNCFSIVRKEDFRNLKYPYIEEICISKAKCNNKDEFYKRIKSAIDECRKGRIYYKIEKKRLACPTYVTCYGSNENSLYPIIVKLYNTSHIGNGTNYKDDKYYNKFKECLIK